MSPDIEKLRKMTTRRINGLNWERADRALVVFTHGTLGAVTWDVQWAL